MKLIACLNKIIVFVSFTNIGFAQTKQDTIYYNADWHVATKSTSSFYRITELQNNNILVKDFYINGNLQMKGQFTSLDPDNKEGEFEYYSSNKIMTSNGSYHDNKKQGKWVYKDTLGNIKEISNYNDGKKDGKAEYYFANGKTKRIEEYMKDSLITGKCFTVKGMDTNFYAAYESAKYKGGQAKLSDYLASSLKYPKLARKKGLEGIVYINFKVNKKGEVNNIIVKQSTDPIFNNAAKKVFEQMPNWIPAKEDGLVVEESFEIPINFQLVDE
jgi:periplasmic protein TonB